MERCPEMVEDSEDDPDSAEGTDRNQPKNEVNSPDNDDPIPSQNLASSSARSPDRSRREHSRSASASAMDHDGGRDSEEDEEVPHDAERPEEDRVNSQAERSGRACARVRPLGQIGLQVWKGALGVQRCGRDYARCSPLGERTIPRLDGGGTRRVREEGSRTASRGGWRARRG